MNTSMTNQFQLNTDTSVDWRTEYGPDPEEDAFVSWPVYEYTYSGTVQLLLLFIHKHQDFVLVDAVNNKIKYMFPLSELEKVSYDENSTSGKTSSLLLFRVAFKPNNVNIFLSKDRNEIINHIIYSYRKENPLISDAALAPKTQPHQNFSGSNFNIQDSVQRPIDNPQDSSGDNHQTLSYKPSFYHAYHEYQVFGIDSDQKLHTHCIGLYPDTIRHFESESKEVFSQHTYLEVKDVSSMGSSKVVIQYLNDNSYTFIVSDRNRDEVIMLIKGRAFLWKNLIADERTLDSFSQKKAPEDNKRGNKHTQLNFPKKFTYPEKEPLKEKVNHAPETDTQNDVTTLNTTASERPQNHIRFIKNGSYLYKHVRKTMSKNKSSTYHERYFRIVYDKIGKKILLQWGPSSSKLKQEAVVKGVSSGIDTIISCSKLSKRLTDNFSFEITLTSGEKLFLVAKDSITYQHWVEGLSKMVKRLIEILNAPPPPNTVGGHSSGIVLNESTNTSRSQTHQ